MNRIRAGRNSLSSTVIKAAVSAAFVLSSFQLSANADSYSSGLQYYQARQFTAALNCFQSALSANPSNYNAIYYKALCHQQLRQTPEALDSYRDLASRFPTSAPGRQALQVLRVSDPTFLRNLISGGSRGGASNVASVSSSSTTRSYGSNSSGGSSDSEGLPAQERLRYRKAEGSVPVLYVQGQINNGSVEWVFDTGCDQTVIGMDTAAQIGMPRPSGPPTGRSMGAGSKISEHWAVNSSVRVGGIERRNFPLLVADRSGVPPLLGRNFYAPYNYTIDNNEGTIHLVKKVSGTQIASSGGSRGSSSGGQNGVPFTRGRSGITVNVEVNGRSIPMLFDTGAGNCLFSKAQVDRLGIRIPDDAFAEVGHGAGGTFQTKIFPVSRMRLGPIEKSNFNIAVTDQPLEEPLLGQTFFSDYQSSIDDQNSVIRFVRR
ncbi:MAG: aspartyl protease family protein [Leptolyngbya sp.]|nr:aspartyl protease family protein [Candidatus Melainabacteria bacterium]